MSTHAGEAKLRGLSDEILSQRLVASTWPLIVIVGGQAIFFLIDDNTTAWALFSALCAAYIWNIIRAHKRADRIERTTIEHQGRAYVVKSITPHEDEKDA